MDLLGGYGSSDDESTSSDVPPKANPSAAPPAATKVASKPAAPAFAKGKKILSLSSVLPQHILERLTKSEVQGEMDSDDEDFAKSKQATTKKPSSESRRGKDEGLSGLLSALHSAPTAGLIAKSVPKAEVKRESMGAAFLSSTTTTTTSKSKSTIRDIHVEDVHSDDDESYVEEPVVSRKRPAPAPPAPPVRRPVSAAPRVAAPPPATAAPPVSEPYYQAPVAAAAPLAPEAAAPSRKRSRKDIERALRQGNLSAVDDQVTTQIAQAQPNQYRPAEETYAVPQHGIKVAATAMYDPKAGAAVIGKGGGRGKNQITHLMAAAANLELQRARNPSQMGNTHRANAKQKYGW